MIATQAPHASALLDGLTDVQKLPDFDYEPITTCYLQYASEVRLEHAFFALIDDAASKQFGQFVFDRGQLDAAHAGLLAVVVSASGEAIELGHEALAAAIAQQLATVLQRAELNQPQWSKVITEKRATFACAPALQRPGNSTGLAGLVIAGDYTASDYPATLESAVRSGVGAAKLLLTN